MIKDIKVLSRLQVQLLGLESNSYDTLSFPFPFPYKRWCLISIHEGIPLLDDRIKRALKSIGCCDFLSLNFWDIKAEHFENLKKEYSDCVLFDRSHARDIIEFIDRLNKDKMPSALIIHCHAGISRSGAVATFACDYLNLDYQTFLSDNHEIRANQYILGVLHDVVNTKARHNGITIS